MTQKPTVTVKTDLEKSHVCLLGARQVRLDPGRRVHVSIRIFNTNFFPRRTPLYVRTRDMIAAELVEIVTATVGPRNMQGDPTGPRFPSGRICGLV
jgi:hypothetical protein